MKAIASQGTSVPDSGKSTTSNGASNQLDHEFAVPTGKSIYYHKNCLFSSKHAFTRW